MVEVDRLDCDHGSEAATTVASVESVKLSQRQNIMQQFGTGLVPAAGVEPATFRSGGERSNPLSYAGLNKMACFKETNQECPLF